MIILVIVLVLVLCGLIGVCIIEYQMQKQIYEECKKSITNFSIKSSIRKIDFSRLKEKSISVYGYGYIGKELCDCLQEHGIEVSYLIDRRAIDTDLKCNIYTIKQELPPVDLIIVAVGQNYVGIVGELKKKGINSIVWVGELL